MILKIFNNNNSINLKKIKNKSGNIIFRGLCASTLILTVVRIRLIEIVIWLMLLQVKSKLGIISSYADAAEGLITHGWITKIEKHGCFVRFYNGVQGFAPRLVSNHLSYNFDSSLYLT